MTYKKGGQVTDSFAGGKKFVDEIAQVAQVPGGLEMLTTMAADELGVGEGGGSKQVRLYNMGEGEGFGNGGLAQAAEQVRSGGRGDDEMLVHMSPEEYEAIESMWGKADINPRTGIPEYGFLSKLWKGIKKTVKKIVKSPLFSFLAPIALNVFAPGLGSAIGGWLGATGKAASTIGNTLVRSGIGAISGGKDGAISGALSGLTAGGVGGKLGEAAGLSGNVARIAGDAVLGGAAGEATGVGFQQGALGQGMASLLGNPMQKMEGKLTEMGKGVFSPSGEFDVTPGSGIGDMTIDPNQADPFGYGTQTLPQTTTGGAVLSDGMPPPQSGNIFSRGLDWVKENPWLAGGGALLAAGALGQSGGGNQGPPGRLDPGTNFYDDLPNLSFDREQMPVQDYYNYGRASAENPGEASFFNPNSIDATTGGGSGQPLPGLGGPPGGGGRGGRGGAPQPMSSIGGDQPRKPGGAYGGMLDKMMAQQQGWQFNEQDGLLYPPGWYGPGGSQPIMGGYEGGQVMAYKLGGLVEKYASGGHVAGPGTGRSDEIPAVLSDGEYVIDSESVALLGDGSTNAGARRLDEMRSNLRKHKGKKLAKGGFSSAAKLPEKYMAKGGEVKLGGSALKELKRFANRLEQAINSGNKKRVAEITSQLDSMSGGPDIVAGLSRGGSVSAVLRTIERAVEDPDVHGATGPKERRAKARRRKARESSGGRRKGEPLTTEEKAKLAEELGAFPKNSRFIRDLRRDLKTKKEGS